MNVMMFMAASEEKFFRISAPITTHIMLKIISTFNTFKTRFKKSG